MDSRSRVSIVSEGDLTPTPCGHQPLNTGRALPRLALIRVGPAGLLYDGRRRDTVPCRYCALLHERSRHRLASLPPAALRRPAPDARSCRICHRRPDTFGPARACRKAPRGSASPECVVTRQHPRLLGEDRGGGVSPPLPECTATPIMCRDKRVVCRSGDTVSVSRNTLRMRE